MSVWEIGVQAGSAVTGHVNICACKGRDRFYLDQKKLVQTKAPALVLRMSYLCSQESCLETVHLSLRMHGLLIMKTRC